MSIQLPTARLSRRLLSLFQPKDAANTDFGFSGQTQAALHNEYLSLVQLALRQWGVPESCVCAEIQQRGRNAAGACVYVGVLRLLVWERQSAIRVLLGLPLLERRMRRLVNASWLAEISFFGGLWLQASEELSHSHGMSELRELLVNLTPPAPR